MSDHAGHLSNDYVGYLPIPRWDGRCWRPLDHTAPWDTTCWGGYPEMPWPSGLDPAELPPPRYALDAEVRFHWGEGVRQGRVQKIDRQGGAYRAGELAEVGGSVLTLARTRYRQSPWYTVYWNGHGRLVREEQILGDGPAADPR